MRRKLDVNESIKFKYEKLKIDCNKDVEIIEYKANEVINREMNKKKLRRKKHRMGQIEVTTIKGSINMGYERISTNQKYRINLYHLEYFPKSNDYDIVYSWIIFGLLKFEKYHNRLIYVGNTKKTDLQN